MYDLLMFSTMEYQMVALKFQGESRNEDIVSNYAYSGIIKFY